MCLHLPPLRGSHACDWYGHPASQHVPSSLRQRPQPLAAARACRTHRARAHRTILAEPQGRPRKFFCAAKVAIVA